MADTAGELTVGVLGGMGPDATVDLLQRILALTPADDDQDHIRVLVDNNPKVPSRIQAIIDGTGPSPAPALAAMARGLEAQGADFLVMPCNTAHHYQREIAAAVHIPFVGLPQLVADYLAGVSPAVERVGLLASTALQHIHLYEPCFGARNLQIVYPAEESQTQLMALIQAVKGNRHKALGADAFTRAAADLAFQGADTLLIACTELSVIADQLATQLPVYDAADLLARAVVARARSGA